MSVRPTGLQVFSIEQWAKLYGTSFDVACGRPVDTFQQPAPLPSDGHFPAAHGSGRSFWHLRPQRRKGGTYAEQGHNWVYHREDHHDDHNCQHRRQHHHDDW